MDWYDRVTGTTEYQRQSWRDNYNDGRAAGDWTGSVNARLDREREAFQGATWSGSSSQPSALELARSMGSGAGASGASTGSGGGGSGAGSSRVTTGPRVTGVGSRLTLTAPGGADWRYPFMFSEAPDIEGVKDEPLKRVGVGGSNEAMGAISDIGWARTNTGWAPVPSQDMKERIEDNIFMEASWFVRNYLTPMFIGGQEVPPAFLDPDYHHYHPATNEWRHGGVRRLDSNGNVVMTGGGF